MLTVYKASAGSGKTFQLVAEYLKLLIVNPLSYRHVLAVTFTNKATTEMKSRILEQLNLLAGSASSPYVAILKKELSKSEMQIRKGARLALTNILHDYSRFSVSTIDSFTQRIIKAFNREMGISPHFVLELDNELVLEEAVDRLLTKVDTDKQLRKWLVEFSREKIMENRSQQIENDIKQLGQELFKEKFQVFFPEDDESVYTRTNIDEFRKELEKIIAVFENTLQAKAAECMKSMDGMGFSVDDFAYKMTGVAGYLKHLSEKNIREPGSRVTGAAESPEKWFLKSHAEKNKLQQLVATTLMPVLNEILAFYTNHRILYQSAAEVKKHLRILGILTDLKEEIKLLLQEKGILQLSDSNLLLNKIIGDSDSPFIYEKIGNRYEAYMLDEFQDTSMLQWSNFKPLVSNALSEGNQVLLVGDVKQSIYRWRNSDWNILGTEINSDFPLHPPVVVSLEKNWRSRKNIIDFNNAVLKSLLETYEEGLFDEFDNPRYLKKFKNVYNEYLQSPGKLDGGEEGKVEISFMEEEDYELNSALLLVEQVKFLQDNGLKASGIAILVRKKDEGALIVETFMEAARKEENAGYNLTVLSNESLFLYASRGVNFVMLVMELLNEPEGKIQQTALLHLWLSWLKPCLERSSFSNDSMQGSNPVDAGSLDGGMEDIFKAELHLQISLIREQVTLSSLDESIMKICDVFGLFKIIAELPYLQTLIDKAAELKITLSNDVSNFLFWWKTKGYNTSVNVNEEVDSVRLLTIHKAKGLEYEAVLLPYFNFSSSWSGTQAPLLWCTPSVEPFNRFPLLPVKACSQLTATIFRDDYLEEKVSSLIDSLNLIYVAFTRAKSALYIHCKKPAERNGKEQGKTVNAILQNALAKMCFSDEFSNCFQQEENLFSFGRLPLFKKGISKPDGNFIESYQYNDFSKKIQLRLKSEDFIIADEQNQTVRNSGKLVHEMLASVRIEADIEKACMKLVDDGLLGLSESNEIMERLKKGMDHPEIKRWFDGSFTILNERNLLTQEKILRPDRIMVSGRHAIVADYKWGKRKQDNYHAQVGRYASILKQCGFEKVEGFIWYITLNEVVKVGEWNSR